jgi:hypothetical protein
VLGGDPVVRKPHVVFGTSIGILKRLGLPRIDLSCEDITRRTSSSFGHLEVTGGVLEKECDALFEVLARRMSG